MAFEDELRVELGEAEKQLSKQLIKIGLEGFNGVLTKTPRDTSFAANSWGVAFGEEPSDSAETSRQPEAVEAPKLFNARIGDTVHLFNNAEYIRPLEDGHSAQAPQGMVSVTLAELESKYGGS